MERSVYRIQTSLILDLIINRGRFEREYRGTEETIAVDLKKASRQRRNYRDGFEIKHRAGYANVSASPKVFHPILKATRLNIRLL
jgi:hypothetical protein